MKMYADTTGRRTAQILADVGMLVLDRAVVVLRARGPRRHPAAARSGAAAGERRQQLGSTMQDAGSTLRQVPLVGEDLQGPFQRAAGTGASIRDAGHQLGVAVGHLATVLGLFTAVIPIVLVAGLWLLLRVRFVRRATAAQRFIDADADLDLFALRALARQPMHRLARVTDDPAGAWRARTRRSSARWRCSSCASGLRPPAAQAPAV